MTDSWKLAAAVRPRITKLARQGKLVDEAFKAVRKAIYPDASADEIAIMRVMFMAGAAELLALQMYGVTEDSDPSAADEMLFGKIVEEVERRHGHTIDLAFTRFDSGPGN